MSGFDPAEWMPGAVHRPLTPVRNYTPGPRRYRRGEVLHSAASNGTGLDHYDYWNREAPKVSCTFYVDKDGTKTQYAPLSAATWTSVQGSWSTYGIETQGWPSEPWTEAQLVALAEITEYGSRIEGWPLQRMVSTNLANRGVGWHNMPYGGEMWNPNAHDCPGDLRVAQINNIIARAKQLRAGPATKPTTKKGKNRMLLIHKRTATGVQFCVYGPGFWDPFTGQDAANAYARTLGNSVEVSESRWADLERKALRLPRALEALGQAA